VVSELFRGGPGLRNQAVQDRVGTLARLTCTQQVLQSAARRGGGLNTATVSTTFLFALSWRLELALS